MRTRRTTLSEGGSIPGVGTIHIDEINPTLKKLEQSLGINLRDNVLGSVGKVDFSGDIDVALQIAPEKIAEFMKKLEANPDITDISKSSVIMTKVKIDNYDQSKQPEDGRARTGYVQVDFMPGDPGWLKTYYHSPGKDSKYKGVFRNIMIATIAALYDRKDSEEQIADGRSVESERYLWSPSDGLLRVRRTPAPNKKGDGYTKKNINTKIGGPWKTANEIATQLGLDSGEDLHSYETLKNAIEKNYPKELQDKIFQSFKDNRQVQDIGVPKDLGESNLHRAILKGLTEAYKAKVNEGPISGIKKTAKFMKRAYDIGNKPGELSQLRDLKRMVKPPKDDPDAGKETNPQSMIKQPDTTPATSATTSALSKGIMKGAALRAVKPNNLRSMPNGARFTDDKTGKKFQYNKNTNQWFNIDNNSETLNGGNGFKLFQKASKVFFDSQQFDSRAVLLEAEARIQHAEDLVFWEGSAGAMRAIESLEDLEKGGHQNVTVKWDGSPAVIFGRNENGEFIFTDKSGFGAKGYDGRAKSAEELEAMLKNRPGYAKDPEGFGDFISRMTAVYPLFEKAVPPNYVGYFKGDMLYFDTPAIEDNHFTFKPNIVQYSIDAKSDLGQKIAKSKAGVVIHREVDENGDEGPLKDTGIFRGTQVLVVPPVTVETPPQVDDARINQLKKMVEQNASAIDDLLNISKLTQMKMKAFPKVLYNYTNTKVDSGLDNLGKDFVKWLDNVKLSGAMKQKIMKYVSENAQAFNAMWNIVRGIMSVKDDVIRQMEKTSSVKSNIPGHGEGGEGFVLAHPKGDIKYVGREFFTKANRAVER